MAATDWTLFTESISHAALGWRDAEEARREWDVTDRLEQVGAPTLILHDRSNALADEERSQELAAGILGARLSPLGIEVGMQNIATATFVTATLLGDATMALVPAIYAFVMLPMAIGLGLAAHLVPPPEQTSTRM